LSIVVGLSGGADSAAAAVCALEGGGRVTGCYLDMGFGSSEGAQECADALGIPLVVKDVRAAMEAEVVSGFDAEYAAARTPSPCVLCNPRVKFKALFAAADELGAQLVATGHYAHAENGRLYQGHPARDQSYMLYRLPAAWLPRLWFPIGLMDKGAVRDLAARHGLAAAAAPDSQDICFIPDGDYAAFLERRSVSLPPGDIVDSAGRVLGRHGGLHRHTVGQRRGLGVSSAGRLYVTRLDAQRNEVVLGPEAELLTRTVELCDLHWLDKPPEAAFRCAVKLRHSPRSYPCVFDGTRLTLDAPQRRPAPGQSAVLYRDRQVLGGGVVV
jgi:tRNA-specific 2-thiouridylase